jgi:predicted RNA binding protein YcfA (HicA-like mRNA interferase family)
MHSKRVTEALQAGGFTLRPSRKHPVYENAEGRKVTLPSTPSDWRTEKNILRDIRRALRPIVKQKEDVDAVLPKQPRKQEEMGAVAKSQGTGCGYITTWRQRPVLVQRLRRKN